MLVFVPLFFFASEYAQIALGESAQQTGLFLLYFFVGFAVAAQIGGRILDRIGAPSDPWCSVVPSPPWAFTCGPDLDRAQLSLAGLVSSCCRGGMGLMLGPASTDAVNRASRFSYGEATGITQTVRNYAASLGLAILGTVLVTELRSRVTSSLVAQGRAHAQGGRRGAPGFADPRAVGAARRRSPTSSASTSPTPPGRCFWSWPG